MFRRIIPMMGALVMFSSVLVLNIPQVSAQTVCGIHNVVADKLKTTFDEQPSAAGLSSNGGMLEVYSSPDGSWTIVLTRPDGLSCLMATGEHWESMPRELAEIES